MAPVDDDEFLDLFSCGICCDFFYEPVTTTCCGKSFCCRCLKRWIKSSVRSAGIPRCPAGCNQKIPFELPASSAALTAAMERIVPDQLKRRQSEDAEEELEEEQVCHGGFIPWQAVAAAQDISFGHILGVRQGTPGIVVGNSSDDHHVTVKFDTREDESDLCVDVLPAHLMKPLPGNFRLGQKVMACVDLHLNGALVVPVGSAGTVIGPAVGTTEFLLILFEERLDGIEGYVAVHHPMLLPHRLLVGGYKLGQKVLCNRDLVINGQLLVSRDTPGKVVAEYSDTRLTVAFDCGEANQNQEGYESHCVFNVQPVEIRTFRDSPWDIRPGDTVRARCDLGTHSLVLVLAGTRGIVHTCIDEMRIIVAFEGNEQHGTTPQLLTVGGNSIEKDSGTSEKERTLTDYAGLVADSSPNGLAVALVALGSEQRRRLAQICEEMVEDTRSRRCLGYIGSPCEKSDEAVCIWMVSEDFSHARVRSAPEYTAEILSMVESGSRVEGFELDGWVKLSDESGYIALNDVDGTPLLQRVEEQSQSLVDASASD